MGSRRALGDHDQVIAVFIGERFDELLEALHREADDAARRADLAAQELLAAFENREQVAARVGALTAAVRVPRPGDIERSRMEPATNAARALMESGGERAPRLRIDPRRRRRHDRACARVAVAGADVRMTDQAPADPDFFQRAAWQRPLVSAGCSPLSAWSWTTTRTTSRPTPPSASNRIPRPPDGRPRTQPASARYEPVGASAAALLCVLLVARAVRLTRAHWSSPSPRTTTAFRQTRRRYVKCPRLRRSASSKAEAIRRRGDRRSWYLYRRRWCRTWRRRWPLIS